MLIPLLITLGSILAVVIIVTYTFLLIGFLRGLPYVPSLKSAIEKMMIMAGDLNGKTVADLGSGDGRILIECARREVARVDGFEINPFLIWFSRKKVRESGVGDRIKVYYKNFWTVDLSAYDVVIIYGIGYIMKKLEEKLLKELRPGALVVSSGFQFPNWKPRSSQGGIYVYEFSGQGVPEKNS